MLDSIEEQIKSIAGRSISDDEVIDWLSRMTKTPVLSLGDRIYFGNNDIGFRGSYSDSDSPTLKSRIIAQALAGDRWVEVFPRLGLG